MIFFFSSITEEACHNSDFAHLISFKMVQAGAQNYLSRKVNQFLGWEQSPVPSTWLQLWLVVPGSSDEQHLGLRAFHVPRLEN